MKLTDIKGIGQKKLEQFESNNILNCLDLIFYLPENFFYSRPGYFEFNRKSYYCGKIRILKTTMLRFKKGIKALCEIIENGEECEIIFFRQGYLKSTLKKDTIINIIGEVKHNSSGNLNFISPKWNMNEDLSSLTGMLPQYKPIENIKSRELEKFIKLALEIVHEESISLKYIEHENIKILFKKVHFPRDEEELREAREIFLLDKMVEYFMKVRYLKKKTKKYLFLKKTNGLLDKLVKDLPFDLSASQKSTVDRILTASGTAFDILLHGEVGSGKTIVAFLASVIYSLNGYQTAFLSPTESLCYQTYLKFREFYPEITCHLVTRSTEKQKLSNAMTDISSTKPVIIFGTHKILSKGFVFSKLGLVVIDEQQKFGVNQRRKLISKGVAGNADVLLMSATPIPRTLALILSAGYTIEKIEKHDTTSLKETFIINPSKLDKLFEKVVREIKKGRQG
ncbi:DEAD/DEAH box helicase, partial [bacterium]|nr:DEAD/DEAH box helicase [bacterium]